MTMVPEWAWPCTRVSRGWRTVLSRVRPGERCNAGFRTPVHARLTLAELFEGCYVLRGNISGWSADGLWKAYIQLTQAEAAFRIQKDDLRLRPVWRQTAKRVEAHILVCFPAFVLWKAPGQFCGAAGLGDCPRKAHDELAQIQRVDVVLPARHGPEIRLRRVSRPESIQAILLQRLRMRLPNRIRITEM